MKTIPLTRGLFTLVDDEDFEFLSKFNWYAQRSGETGKSGAHFYAASRPRKGQKLIFIHRLLVPGAKYVDHRNHDSLDNRRENLRECTNQQNGINQRPRRDGLPRGIRKSNQRWKAEICFNYRNRHLGTWDTWMEAALARDAGAIHLFGEFAPLNTDQDRARAFLESNPQLLTKLNAIREVQLVTQDR